MYKTQCFFSAGEEPSATAKPAVCLHEPCEELRVRYVGSLAPLLAAQHLLDGTACDQLAASNPKAQCVTPLLQLPHGGGVRGILHRHATGAGHLFKLGNGKKCGR